MRKFNKLRNSDGSKATHGDDEADSQTDAGTETETDGRTSVIGQE